MKAEKPDYEVPFAGVAWTRGAGHPAGVYMLDGRCHVVALDSPAEQILVESGALHMANVKFDREHLERSHPNRSVRLIEPLAAAHMLSRDPRGGDHVVRSPDPRIVES